MLWLLVNGGLLTLIVFLPTAALVHCSAIFESSSPFQSLSTQSPSEYGSIGAQSLMFYGINLLFHNEQGQLKLSKDGLGEMRGRHEHFGILPETVINKMCSIRSSYQKTSSRTIMGGYLFYNTSCSPQIFSNTCRRAESFGLASSVQTIQTASLSSMELILQSTQFLAKF